MLFFSTFLFVCYFFSQKICRHAQIKNKPRSKSSACERATCERATKQTVMNKLIGTCRLHTSYARVSPVSCLPKGIPITALGTRDMNEFQDGWGDEESLGVDLDVDVDVEDGWGDDELDMLNDDEDEDVDGAQGGTSELVIQQGTETSRSCSNRNSTSNGNSNSNSNSAISVDEGWDWDDGDVNASNHGPGHGHGHGQHTIINTDTCTDTDTGISVSVGVGNTRRSNDFGTHTNAAGGSVSGRSAVVDRDPEPILKIAEQKLLQYITDLGGDPSSSSSLLNTINDELALKHNNQEKALELCRYYHERENLREYTLDAEVPRMDYQIMISDDLILTETNEIQHYFHDHPVDNLVDDMLLRASNQSILADLFPVITGTGGDKIIRMQFGANAVANRCRLVLDMRHGHGRMRTLQVECTLTVSVPAGSCKSISTSTSTGTASSSSSSAKLDLAALRFMIHFSPEPSAPFIKYQLVSIQPLLDIHNNDNGNGNGDREKVRAAAALLDPREMEAIQEMTREREHSNVNVNVRDNFLNSVMATATHQTVTATTAGLKSALQEIDDVVNVKGKFNYLKNAMPALALPSADEILTAEREECASASAHTSGSVSGSMNGSVSGHFPRPAPPPPPRPVPVQAPYQRQRHQPPTYSSSLSVSSINAPHSNSNGIGIGIGNSNGADTSTNVLHAATSASRPKPIIGGMLISGITRLAKAAAIPDVNVDVNLNEHGASTSTSTSMQAQGSMPVLYRKEMNVTASNPPPPPPPPHQQQWSDDGVDDAAAAATDDDDDDGWSDDDLDDGLDDLDDDVDKALAPILNQTTPTSASAFSSTSTSASAFTKSISTSTTAITNVGQAPTPAPVNAMRNNNTNSIHAASSAISPSASTSTVNTGTSDTYIKIEHPKMDDHANAKVSVNVNVNAPTKDNEYVGISSEYVNVDLNDHGLPVELKAERDYLLQQLTLIENTKNDDCDGFAVASRDYDEVTGIVPTRKRFVPRSHILNIVNIGVGGER